MIDLRPAARIKDPALLTRLKFEYDECELTGETQSLHLHHVIFRSHCGDDLRQNIVCMARWKHDLYHAGDPQTMFELAVLVEHVRSDVAGYISEKLGSPAALLVWFAKHGL